jgi:hypothetical protein
MFSANVNLPPSSELMKELRKWEQHNTRFAMTEDGDMKPGNPYVFRPYPKMLYRAQKNFAGKTVVMQPMPEAWHYASVPEYERACLEVETLNRRGQLIVDSEEKERIAAGQGWCVTQADAIEQAEREEQAIAQAAGEAAYAASRMSEKARAELKAADEVTHEHVVDVQPRKRGRKPKVVTGSGVVDE